MSPRRCALVASVCALCVAPTTLRADTAAAEVTPAQPGVVSETPQAPPEASGPAGPELAIQASFFSRYELRDNYASIGASRGRFLESDGVAYRARFGLATTPIDLGDQQSVMVALVPQASGFWADSGSTLNDDGLDVHEAYVRLAGASFRADVGRFEMAYGDHLVIGNVGWHETGRSFDGARVRVTPDESGAWIDGFVTQLSEGRTLDVTEMGAGDWLFFGVYAGIGPAIADNIEIDVYGFGELWPSSSDGAGQLEQALEGTGGARVKLRRGLVDYRAETGFQFGKRPGEAGSAREALAFHGDAEVGASLVADRLRFALGGFYATGDDPETNRDEGWNQLFPTAHKFLGFADVIGGRSNITGGIARVSYNVSPKLKLASDGHVFYRPFGADGDVGYAGAEIDAGVLYKLGAGLKLRGGYSLFIPNMPQFAADDLASFAEVELRYDLK